MPYGITVRCIIDNANNVLEISKLIHKNDFELIVEPA